MQNEDDYQRSLRERLTSAPIQPPPAPWRSVGGSAVGGLTHVGYAPESDLLLVASSQGRGVFNCLTGEKVARDPDDEYDLDEIRLACQGIGPLAEQTIRIAGLTGGGLPDMTHDGWSLEAMALPWPQHSIFIKKPWKPQIDNGDGTKIAVDSACELRAYGFSETGRSFVVATSCDLMIFSRE